MRIQKGQAGEPCTGPVPVEVQGEAVALTPDADAYFPDNSPSQLASLVGYLREVHPAALDGWLAEWMEYRTSRVQAADGESTIEDRVAQFVDNATRRGAIMSLESLDDEAIVSGRLSTSLLRCHGSGSSQSRLD